MADRLQEITYNVPSTTTPTIEDAIHQASATAASSIITINLEPNNYKVRIEMGQTRNSDLGIGLLFPTQGNRTFIVHGNNSVLNSGVRITNGKVIFHSVIFHNSSRNNSGYGIFVTKSTLDMVGCSIRQCRTIGLWCYLDAKVTASNVTIERNKEAGVSIYFASAVFDESHIKCNGEHGLVISEGASCALKNVKVTGHVEAGVLSMRGSTVNITGGEISHNNDGIVVIDGGQVQHTCVQLVDNKCDIYADDDSQVVKYA